MNIGIYKITNPEGKIYIGQSINIPYRWEDYKAFKHKTQPLLYDSFKKYGWYNHSFEIIEECLQEDLNQKEQYWVDFYNSKQEGLNCDPTLYLVGKAGPKIGTTKGIKKITEEGKKVKSEKMKKLWEEGKFKRNNSKPVIDTQTNKHYKSRGECEQALKISTGTFTKLLNSGRFSYVTK